MNILVELGLEGEWLKQAAVRKPRVLVILPYCHCILSKRLKRNVGLIYYDDETKASETRGHVGDIVNFVGKPRGKKRLGRSL